MYDQEFNVLSWFAPKLVRIKAERADKFVKGLKSEIQSFVRVLRPTIQANALRMAVDLSLHERS